MFTLFSCECCVVLRECWNVEFSRGYFSVEGEFFELGSCPCSVGEFAIDWPVILLSTVNFNVVVYDISERRVNLTCCNINKAKHCHINSGFSLRTWNTDIFLVTRNISCPLVERSITTFFKEVIANNAVYGLAVEGKVLV